jgi:hypothetical protein
MHERQAVIFGIVLSFLALAFAAAAGIYSGTLSLPWANRTFATETTSPPPTVPPAPCPPADALPVAANQVTLNIYNGAGVAGLAASTAQSLGERGFLVGVTDNAPTEYDGVVHLTFGMAGVASAYTIAAHFPETVMTLDARADASVDVTLGTEYTAMIALEDVQLDPAVPLVGPEGCIPYETLVTPAPTDTAAPPAA